MDVKGLGDTISLYMGRTQDRLSTDVTRLSSGLRINTAADDPSGLAISTGLQTVSQGLDEGTRSLQTAANALTVADGAMSTVGRLLQRMRVLVVEASSDLQGPTGTQALQGEINQLRAEIDTIVAKTNFNGRPLLDGSASSQPTLPYRALIPRNDQLSGGGTVIDTTFDPTQPSVPQPGPQIYQTLTIDSYDPILNVLNCTVTISSADPSFGPLQTAQIQVDNGTNNVSNPPFGPPPGGGIPQMTQTDQFGNPVLGFNIGTFNAADVGLQATIVSVDGTSKAPGAALAVSVGDAEGDQNTVDIPAVTAQNLGVNEIVLGTVDQNQAMEYRIDYGISTLGNYRSQIGAQVVALNEAAANAQIYSTNAQASASNISDLNVGQQTTALTKDQIQVQVQQKLLADVNATASRIENLVDKAAIPK